jgi:hypothetical protein
MWTDLLRPASKRAGPGSGFELLQFYGSRGGLMRLRLDRKR